MSTFYHPSFVDDKAHLCDNCKIDDGRATLYWKESNFDLCHECLLQLTKYHVDPLLKASESLTVRRMAIPESLRNEIFDRDGNKCIMCNSTSHLQLDHIKPFSRGGRTVKENLQTLCAPCNLKKRAS